MKYRILYVEDEMILGQLVAEALGKLGYEVHQVTDGAEAISAFKMQNPHLCLLDVMLPGKDGYDIARQIRMLDSKVPMIFLTAKVQATDVVAGFHSGGNDYIRKPFSMDELAVRIRGWITEKYGGGSDEVLEYTAGPYRFLPREQRLTTPTADVVLTFKEATVLAALFAHRNQVISRNHLMQKVWDSETIYNSRTLDVYINRLRKHFENSPNQILTLKGVGYKFITE